MEQVIVEIETTTNNMLEVEFLLEYWSLAIHIILHHIDIHMTLHILTPTLSAANDLRETKLRLKLWFRYFVKFCLH